MNTQIINTSKTVAAIIVSVALLGGIAEAEIVSHSKNIVIELPTDLPELAQHRGIALQLYSGNEDGKTYLYIEQHEGQRLVVFDVTDPLHMKMVNAVTVSAPAPFDFVGSVGGTALPRPVPRRQGYGGPRPEACKGSCSQGCERPSLLWQDRTTGADGFSRSEREADGGTAWSSRLSGGGHLPADKPGRLG